MEVSEPAVHDLPHQVADDAWLLRHLHKGDGPFCIYVNSLVVKAAEPIIVDTGASKNSHWLEDVAHVVDPADVRWIFLSHDDLDHVGNLRLALAACPDATLVTNWLATERMAGDFDLPLGRCRWLDDGESFEAGDRRMTAIRPPVFGSPTTRGLFDSSSRLYWASDCFATPVPDAVDELAELDDDYWEEGFLLFQRALAPWHSMLDPTRYAPQVDRIEALDPSVIATSHGPALRGSYIDRALTMLRRLPEMEPAQLPGQAELDATLAAL